jgi:ankyrin repeat protein
MRDCRTKGETPLHRAAAFASIDAIRLLLDAGADVQARDMNGETPLSWASWYLRSAAVLALLCYGPHRIHPDAVRGSAPDIAIAWGGGMDASLLGVPHLDK